MSPGRPPKAEPADIAKHIVASGLDAVLYPGDQVVEGDLSHPVLDTAMGRPAHGALDQQMRVAGVLDATAVTLLEPERHAEVRGLMERHHRARILPVSSANTGFTS